VQPTVDPLKILGDLAAEAIELLVDADDAFPDELDLVHQAIGDHVEMTSRLRRGRSDFGTQLDQLLIHAGTLKGACRRVKCVAEKTPS
jgi:hypothetical protein